MKERFEFNLSPVWMLMTAIVLILPVFLPSSAHPQHFYQDIIGTLTLMLNILSFPAGLLSLPFMFAAKIIFGVNPNTIGGAYINLFLLCLFGYAQWFWLVPRLLRSESRFQILNLFGEKSKLQLSEANAADDFQFRNSKEQTPVERVFREKD
jgi:hypothetical protein